MQWIIVVYGNSELWWTCIPPVFGLHTAPSLGYSTLPSLLGLGWWGWGVLLWWVAHYSGLENCQGTGRVRSTVTFLDLSWRSDSVGMGWAPGACLLDQRPRWLWCWKFRHHSLKTLGTFFIQTFWRDFQNWGTYGVWFLRTVLMLEFKIMWGLAF